MYIKQITISNFRSFRNQDSEIHPFSPTNNVVVGRNGTGKSNLFDAVQFVLLCPKFWNLPTEERQALLHEGSGSAAVNAFVEIVFDNSDNRFSLDSDQVVIRRTIGHKKDEFFLQHKRVTKNEVMSLLEGAGFSRSNPYFIVQQGKVNALCVMSDADRLNLLKEVAGTTVYDEKKVESLEKMMENKMNIDKIDETLQFMEERLDELRDEKEELTQYQMLDRERRAIEYTLYDKELRRARETLDEIEHARSEEIAARTELYTKVRDADEAIQTAEALLVSKSKHAKRNRSEITSLEDAKKSAMTLRTKLELTCKELEDIIRAGEERYAFNQLEIERLEKEISIAQRELNDSVQPKFDEAKDALTRVTRDRDEAIKRIEALYAKQGRGKQFKSRQDRDTYLCAQVEELTGIQEEKEAMLQEKRQMLANLRRSVTSRTKELEKIDVDVSKKNTAVESLSSEIKEKKHQRNLMAEKRKEQWRNIDALNEKISEAKEEVKRAFSTMRKIIPRATAMGLDALSLIVEQEGLIAGQQYFGLLLQNFELVDPKFQTAIEVAAQNALFHVIVDSDETAARLMKRLEQDRRGRVTFLPLNQLHIDDVRYPDSSDVVPMLQRCIRYDSKVHRAMKHVFGKKLLARTVDVASTWAAECNMDTITLDGDLCSRKGALSGGFVDNTKSRLRANSELTIAEGILNRLQAEQESLSKENDSVDQLITSIMSEIQRLEAKMASYEHSINRFEEQASLLRSQIDVSTSQIEKLESDIIPPIVADINQLMGQINQLQDEIGTDLCTSLTDEERTLLNQLKVVQSELEFEIETQSQILDGLTIDRQRLTSLLNDNLLKRKVELQENTSDSVSDSQRSRYKSPLQTFLDLKDRRMETLDHRRRELNEAILSFDDIEAKLLILKQGDEKNRAGLVLCANELEKLRVSDTEFKKELQQAQETEEKLMNKRSMCVSKRELYMRKIQELGSLPPTSELSKYSQMSISSLVNELESVNKKLKKYAHVNKKAFDQFVNFSEQRVSLLKRKDELDKGAEKVHELVESLDRQKDEAINRTFRGVSAHFRNVFKELVPHGSGELIMKTSLDDRKVSDNYEDNKSNDSKNLSVDLYQGIGMKVSFTQIGENYMMSQLSGGQKALVALALIFAIQRCDPAPFYLFDELDQALDSTYRAAVAAMIQRQATSVDSPTQFICSTFRPELVAVASRCYGISLQNKVSSIHLLSKKDALHFIANLMSEEEAVGEVTSLAPSKSSSSYKKLRMTADGKDDRRNISTITEDGRETLEDSLDAASVAPSVVSE